MTRKIKNLTYEQNEQAKEQLIQASMMSNKELFTFYNTSNQGLTNDEIIQSNKEKYGVNVLSKKSKNTI
ncbi:UNVERIFIED_CONTAM: hypothetical protein O8I53_10530 [Campylobacter lari]